MSQDLRQPAPAAARPAPHHPPDIEHDRPILEKLLNDLLEASRTWPRLPAAALEAGPRPERRAQILAAEDNPINQRVLAAMLGPFDIDLAVTADGRDAVETYLRRHGGFDLILLDIRMPRMDGLEAAGLIRRAEAALGWRPTPILALSADVQPHQIADFMAAGMDGYIAKPITATRLLGSIGETLAARTA